eukprot:m.120068 g.120068  ORF g.120068 m.120068 type:complete len:802 (-) comp14545_c0_seq3:58-2463(-)
MDANKVASRAMAGYLSGNDALSGRGGDEDQGMRRTRQAVEEMCAEDGSVCLVCIGTVAHTEAVWTCGTCAALFHLPCIQAWIRDGVAPPSLLSTELFPSQQRKWHCPKCRCEYNVNEAPSKYLCFCGKLENPPFDPWLAPHSCGSPCGRKLKSNCGHACSMLCHPGACPPCPRQIEGRCPCGRIAAARRCGQPAPTCGSVCARTLACGSHKCQARCHEGECSPCELQATRSCLCGAQRKSLPCGNKSWSCDKVCGRPLSCGHHRCEQVCHAGSCGDCPRSQKRTCPCGKSASQLPCTEDVPSCGDTCGLMLSCGLHRCVARCHQGPCSPCLQESEKQCRCGQTRKRMACSKLLLCERRCEALRQCGRHACRRKCCTGRDCPPCEEVCGRKLQCQNHKCQSPCHSGPCYPCPLTVTLTCACGAASVTLPCGRERRARPPQCTRPCTRPSACHHPTRMPHTCHSGPCPPCVQPCDTMQACGHACAVPCHDPPPEPVVVPRGRKPSTPTTPPPGLGGDAAAAVGAASMGSKTKLVCPPCSVRVPVRCLGEHQTKNVACHAAAPYSCSAECGQRLACGMHDCHRPCHARNEGCGVCTAPCSRPRPTGCPHRCPEVCHRGACPDCHELLRIPCHCGALVMHPLCCEYLAADASLREASLSCRGGCPRLLACGHACAFNCHSGPCSNVSQCRKKRTIRCPCQRRRVEFLCRDGTPTLECDADCRTALEEAERIHKADAARQAAEAKAREEEENARLLAMIQGGRKKKKRVRTENEATEITLLDRVRPHATAIAAAFMVLLLALWFAF